MDMLVTVAEMATVAVVVEGMVAMAAAAMARLEQRSTHQAQAAPLARRLSIPRWSMRPPLRQRVPPHSSHRLDTYRLPMAACCSRSSLGTLAMVAEMAVVVAAVA